MKIRMYLDLWPGPPPTYGYSATSYPSAKIPGNKRFAFDVFIPDEAIHDVDAHAPEVSRPERVPDDSGDTP